ncbi:helix-hairpin-helix domain-containing protein [Pseudoclavibacter sp. 13-3]|uniref:helix-hairpin-helix domain-containing protein n=1 Tax=Pseudoclavibacter sp. 13-3 TaxID=2901228 RepID=UPI001E4102F1|nr:helix-hairpin-helix domain-containing protein [Pseudoclavibacter sp. 13-3]MCD7100618.1 helix-hairpin-helix domain-containing protein [Pseudoclavibacter sp. 13-3]
MAPPAHPTASTRFLHVRALILLTAFALVVCVLLSACRGSAQTTVDPDQGAATTHGQPGSASGADAPDGALGASTTGDGVHVHVTGAVRAPGLHRLDRGSRIADAIEKAGGFAADADIEALNLARVLVDGEQLVVPRRGEQAAAPTPSSPSAAAGQPGSTSSSASGGSGVGGQVNLNSATTDQLQTLPGVGPSTAQKIIDSRNAEGPFASVDDLTRVAGIGEKTLEKLRSRVTV